MTVNSPLFIDFEASSLSLECSYPIQVAFSDQDKCVHKYFISPETVIDWTDWNAQSEEIHKFSCEYILRHGQAPKEVARILNSKLRNHTVYCNGFVNDKFWLERLFYAADQTIKFKMADFFTLVPEIYFESLAPIKIPMYTMMSRLAREAVHGRTHDAGNDVKYLVNLFSIIDKVSKLSEQGIRVLNNEKKYITWLMSEIDVLSKNTPLSRLQTDQGFEQVLSILNTIEYGEFS